MQAVPLEELSGKRQHTEMDAKESEGNKLLEIHFRATVTT